jgi:glycosyltransferase involved in cell wall biosynthesis
MKKISIIIPFAGNVPERERNLQECLRACLSQTYKAHEIILVEQSLDGEFYRSELPEPVQWCPISDKEWRGFNLSWCRKVVDRQATGDIIVLKDSDFIFPSDYFSKIAEFNGKFAAGAETYYWCNSEDPTRAWLSSRDFSVFQKYGSAFRDRVWQFKSMSGGVGYGAILVFNREWYWNEFGGYIENFFRWGWEDNLGWEIASKLLNVTELTVDRIPSPAYHLSHRNRDVRNQTENRAIFQKYAGLPREELLAAQRALGVGDPAAPTLLPF